MPDLAAPVVTPEIIKAAEDKRYAARARRSKYLWDAREKAVIGGGVAVGSTVAYASPWTLRQWFDQEETVTGWFGTYTQPTIAAYFADILDIIGVGLGWIGFCASAVLLLMALFMLVCASLVRIPRVPVDPFAGWDEVISRLGHRAVLNTLPDHLRGPLGAAMLDRHDPTSTASDDTSVAPEYAHLVCCDEDRALCGEDVTGEPWDVDTDPDCPRCAPLAGYSCGDRDCENDPLAHPPVSRRPHGDCACRLCERARGAL